MRLAAAEMGFKQVVRKPTSGSYLLDLVLTDIQGVEVEVLPQIAVHCLVEVTAPLPMPMAMTVQREVWHFRSAE